MKAVEMILSSACEKVALAFWKEMAEHIAAYAKSEKCPENFGNDLLWKLCRLGEGSKIEFYMPLLERLLSLNTCLDVELCKVHCKSHAKWDIYEKLHVFQMGESLKG